MTTDNLSRKFTLGDLRKARQSGQKLAMLTCYDYSTARLMDEVGVPLVLVGDSAANVILGYSSTVPVSLSFMIEITRAVRRGAPNCFLVADMPFGSYHASTGSAMRNVCRMVQLSGCDCVKMEVAKSQLPLVRRLADAGVAVMVHLGLRPQSVGVLGGYKVQGRSEQSVQQIVDLACSFVERGAVSILLEAVPPEVSQKVVAAVDVPVIGCGAGPACHGHVFVTHDGLRLTARAPKFAPDLADVATVMKGAFAKYMNLIASGEYPSPGQMYSSKEKQNA